MTNLIFGEIDISALLDAKKTLDEGIESSKTNLEKAGCIQAFEYTYELSWKIMKKILYMQNIETNFPKDVFREAAKYKLIEDPQMWFEFMKKRNLTSHSYDKKLAESVLEILPTFKIEVEKFIDTILKL